jgi:hypothetical protein
MLKFMNIFTVNESWSRAYEVLFNYKNPKYIILVYTNVILLCFFLCYTAKQPGSIMTNYFRSLIHRELSSSHA